MQLKECGDNLFLFTAGSQTSQPNVTFSKASAYVFIALQPLLTTIQALISKTQFISYRV